MDDAQPIRQSEGGSPSAAVCVEDLANIYIIRA
jgi:hypothetical protein